MRASSCSARAGTLTSKLGGQRRLERGLLDAQPVGVGRDHPQLALRGRDEDAGEHRPRLVPRGRAGDLQRGRRRTRRPAARPRTSASGSGNGGKSSVRSVRMWKVALPETSSTSCSAARSSSETVGAGQRADDVDDQPGRQDDDALAGDLRLERDPQADVHVGGAQLAAIRRRGELDAGQRLDRAAGRGDPADRLQLSEQDVSLEGDLHDEYLRRKVEVIGRIEAVEKCAFVRNERGSCRSRRTGKCVSSRGRLVARGACRRARGARRQLRSVSFIRSETRLQACRTVAWLRPPNASPIVVQRGVGELAREMDGHLARPGDPGGAAGRDELRRRESS